MVSTTVPLTGMTDWLEGVPQAVLSLILCYWINCPKKWCGVIFLSAWYCLGWDR